MRVASMLWLANWRQGSRLQEHEVISSNGFGLDHNRVGPGGLKLDFTKLKTLKQPKVVVPFTFTIS